ncbi:dihydrofolate reductase [Gammaproteobacteria bacterium]|nr:dihydrofolate reductase [SAR86 cluster bacterium]MDB3994655.1 dihydrofolate reductase [Gammaproteobacteria bacterium]MDB4816349.1 dihydrofolate reductase [Gammaproteobacteria bacterium]|tara:strand:+ start:3441 stop:3920 length:480 start_codon:yes stop_codon:yes gene_type:complete
MEIILIAAVDQNLAIGKDGGIPWDIKEDLKFFREKTQNSAIIMGRATFDSIGRPLPNRKNIVMTRSPQDREGVTEVTSVEDAIDEAKIFSQTINIIGGEYIYKEFLPIATKLIITEVGLNINSPDAYFPEWSTEEWKEVSRTDSSENGIKFSFVEYLKI